MVLIYCLIVFDVLLQMHFLVILEILINVIGTESGAYTVISTEDFEDMVIHKKRFLLRILAETVCLARTYYLQTSFNSAWDCYLESG